MPRTLLISRCENGRALKTTYGIRKVRSNMKFSFIIGAVTVFLWCGIAIADSRILNDLKYLEYLNDLDRRNVELDDIHRQWPFHNIARDLDEEGDNADVSEIDREKLLEAVNLARVELANKHHQNYRDRLFDRLEDGFKQLKETTDRADQLSQYRRYKPFEQDALEEARMYPERNDEAKFDDEENNSYQNSDIIIDENEEEEPIIRPALPRPFFPRIAPVEKPMHYETAFQDSSSETEEEPPEDQVIEVDEMPHIRPTFPKSYLFPRIAPVDIPVNYKIDDFDEPKIEDNNHHHDMHEEYKFKDGEEFPHSNVFNEVAVAEDPSEFAVGPTDPRFYRDAEENKAKPQDDSSQLIGTKTYYLQKPKMNSRSDLQKQQQLGLFRDAQETNPHLEHKPGKDVEVVPFKPSDAEADTAGVYIIAIIAGISAAATVGLIAVGIGWYNLQKHMKNAEDSDYPSYGIVGPNKDFEKKDRDEAGDRRLAQSAQMYHYQHQKQQIIAMGRNPQGHGSQSDTDEEEDEEGNYTVYECPGLASIEGPLEVKNPMFDDDLLTPSLTPSNPTNNATNK
ncbi:unnamed protein product [Ceutorhynchus assimilis]|uniref:Uncharacterized protein n=1 Tax=Ceutorhynchus assimilis TaxID=467358 RepID=A0A9P0DG86_9CUCU|nr:unnamed protein product [Ceutorhynchus assimilis]